MKSLQKKYVYDNYTYNSKNPLARFAHRSRFNLGLKLIRTDKKINVLDFGCADGRFLNSLNVYPGSNLVGYEPFMESSLFDKVPIVKTWEEVKGQCKKNQKFDYVLCFEVLEHLNVKNQIDVFKKFFEVIKDEGKLIISVPVEFGFPSVLKNIRRVSLHGSSEIYSLKNIFFSFFRKKTKFMKSHRKEDKYLSHMGFFYQDMENIFLK